MEARDLVRLRTPLFVLALSLLLALGAGWHATVRRQKAVEDERTASGGFNAAHSRYEAARRDEALMRLTIRRFRVLEAQHMIGDESRLGWIERLRATREAAGWGQLDYELRPRLPIPMPTAPGRYALTASRMLVTGDMLHAQRLITFLDRLTLESSALVIVRSCDIKRHSEAEMTDHDAPLQVRCELDWITVADKPTDEATR